MKKNHLIFLLAIVIVILSFTIALFLDTKNLKVLSSLTGINDLVIKDGVAVFNRNTTVNDIEELVESEVQVFDGEVEVDKTSILKTNEILRIGSVDYPIAVLGDVKADGKINVQDVGKAYVLTAQVEQDFSGLTKAEVCALDWNLDDKYNLLDVNQIYKQIGSEDETITLNKNKLNLDINQSEQLISEIHGTTEGIVITWTSSDENVASVDQNGLVTGISYGTAIITASTNTGKIARCTVRVGVEPTDIKFYGDKTSIKVVLNNTRTLVPIVLPENAIDKTVTWESSDPSIATVQNGVISGVGLGKTTITATTINGLTATCEVEVVVHEESISIVKKNGEDLTELSFYENKTVTVYTAATPSNAYYTPVTWTSSNPSVATVNENGEITSIKGGTTTITATSLHGKTDSIVVNVKVMESVTLDRDTIKMNEGNSRTIQATVSPEDATYKSVEWSSSDTSVATVDANGKVLGVGPGTATITAATRNSSATCEVTIRETYEINDLSTSSSESAARSNTEKLNNHLKNVANSDDYQKIKLKEGTYYFYIDIDTAISISSYKENKVTYRMDNIYLNLNNSKIKMYGTLDNPISDYRYYIFKIDDVKNVSISNGIIVGDRKSHDYSITHPDADILNTHEWGMGINIKDSKNVTIKGLEIYDTTGDGIRIQDGMSFDSDTCSEVNNTNGIYLKNNKIHGVRRDGITIIAGSNIEITGNEIYNIGGNYNHLDGTTKTGTDPRAGINLERNKSETCGYTDPSTGKSKTQIEEFIRGVIITNNKIYNNAKKDITFLNGIYDMNISNNELDKPVHTTNNYVYCDAPTGGVYEGVNRCYIGDNINFYSENKIKKTYNFTINNNIGTTGIDSLDIVRDDNLAAQFGTTSDRVCCKSFRGNNNCQKPENNPYPMTCNNQ